MELIFRQQALTRFQPTKNTLFGRFQRSSFIRLFFSFLIRMIYDKDIRPDR